MDQQLLRKHLINYSNFESIFVVACKPWKSESGRPKVPSRGSQPTYSGNSKYLSSREAPCNIEARPLHPFAMPSESCRHLVTLLSRLMYLQKPNLLELSQYLEPFVSINSIWFKCLLPLMKMLLVAFQTPSADRHASRDLGLRATVFVFPNSCRVKMVPDSSYGPKRSAMFLQSSKFYLFFQKPPNF